MKMKKNEHPELHIYIYIYIFKSLSKVKQVNLPKANTAAAIRIESVSLKINLLGGSVSTPRRFPTDKSYMRLRNGQVPSLNDPTPPSAAN